MWQQSIGEKTRDGPPNIFPVAHMVLASFGWFGGDWRALFDGGAFAFHGVSVIFVSIVLVPVFFVFFYSACFAEGVPESW